jgi:hypothetical protein
MMGTGTNTLVSATLELMICIIGRPLMQTWGAAFLVNWRWKLEEFHQYYSHRSKCLWVVQQKDDGHKPSGGSYTVSSPKFQLSRIAFEISICLSGCNGLIKPGMTRCQ